MGWDVSAFDISTEGKNKALRLAKNNKVILDYKVGELPNLGYPDNNFDVISLIYAHFPAEIKADYHKRLGKLLRKGGILIFEAFSKNHIKYVSENPEVGGPRDLGSLFSIEEIKADFNNFEIIELQEKEVELSEGLYHRGKGSVIRFIGLRN
jgi:SAM-dependent methyltransferase